MNYKITFNDKLNASNVMKYFEQELSKTSLIKNEIEVDLELQNLIGLTRIEIILKDNDINNIYIDFELGAFEFKSGNNVLISKEEINLRFNDVLNGTLEHLNTL